MDWSNPYRGVRESRVARACTTTEGQRARSDPLSPLPHRPRVEMGRQVKGRTHAVTVTIIMQRGSQADCRQRATVAGCLQSLFLVHNAFPSFASQVTRLTDTPTVRSARASRTPVSHRQARCSCAEKSKEEKERRGHCRPPSWSLVFSPSSATMKIVALFRVVRPKYGPMLRLAASSRRKKVEPT